MSVPQDDPKLHALKREWAAARLVVIGGLILAVCVAGYYVYRQRPRPNVPRQEVVATPRYDPKLVARVEAAVCTAELLRAKDLGMVPQYGALATTRLLRANVPRRYICEAATHLTRYFISADLLCANIAEPRCVSVYRVALKDGTLIYARPD
jgi:hypothetical protein